MDMNFFKLETTFKGVNLGKHFAAAKRISKRKLKSTI